MAANVTTCARCGRSVAIVAGSLANHKRIEAGRYTAANCAASGRRPEDLQGLTPAQIDGEAEAIRSILARHGYGDPTPEADIIESVIEDDPADLLDYF